MNIFLGSRECLGQHGASSAPAQWGLVLSVRRQPKWVMLFGAMLINTDQIKWNGTPKKKKKVIFLYDKHIQNHNYQSNHQ